MFYDFYMNYLLYLYEFIVLYSAKCGFSQHIIKNHTALAATELISTGNTSTHEL
jgi:hypothetical protein